VTSPDRPDGPWVTHWGADPWTWNVEGDDGDDGDAEPDGMPGRGLVGGAVAFWLSSTPGAGADDVALVFNLPSHLADDVSAPGDFHPCDIGEAVQVWSILNGGDTTVEAACAVFARPPSLIISAVEDHHWMMIEPRGSGMCIGHDGE
jgi:hypothetical protein